MSTLGTFNSSVAHIVQNISYVDALLAFSANKPTATTNVNMVTRIQYNEASWTLPSPEIATLWVKSAVSGQQATLLIGPR